MSYQAWVFPGFQNSIESAMNWLFSGLGMA